MLILLQLLLRTPEETIKLLFQLLCMILGLMVSFLHRSGFWDEHSKHLCSPSSLEAGAVCGHTDPIGSCLFAGVPTCAFPRSSGS